jgi:uncharacterized membrane protein SirB2
MEYLTLKQIHVGSVIASYALFFVRGLWMMRVPAMLERRWVKTVPHVIDTVLLVSAIALAMTIRQYPFGASWLTAKVLGLIVYIVLGTIALKRGKSRRVRVLTWIAAQLVFFYIVAVALTHNPFVAN